MDAKVGYIFIALGVLGALLLVASFFMKGEESKGDKASKWMMYSGAGLAIVGIVGWALIDYYAKKEKYEEIKKAVAAGKLPSVALERPDIVTRVESPVDSRDERLVLANKCTSIYAGGVGGMGAETDCKRIKTNPNGFSF